MQNDYEEIEYTEDNLQHTDTQQEGEPTEKARVLGLIFSFLIPLLGILLFYLSRNKVINPNAYLYSAFFGFLFHAITYFL